MLSWDYVGFNLEGHGSRNSKTRMGFISIDCKDDVARHLEM